MTSHPHDPEARPSAARLISAEPFDAPTAIDADARLLIHDMPSITGEPTRASTLLFTPREAPPSHGWPVVVWVHGTTTGGQRLRAPSLSPTLDGDLTAAGSVTRWVWVISSLVQAGYAVVAPDLEGKGSVATVPLPYYSAASLGRSQLAGVTAARQAEERLSSRWASVGHSDGGHGALFAERYAPEGPGLQFAGAVAVAPFTSVAAIVDFNGDQARRDPARALDYVVQQNFNVALIAAGIEVEDPTFDLTTIMGQDLQQLMGLVRTEGSVQIVAGLTEAIDAKSPAEFSGVRRGWDAVPAVREFLIANDPAAMPGFALRRPTLILQGGQDVSVPAELTAAFAAKLADEGSPVQYRVYPDADHFTVLLQAVPDALDFLSRHL